MIIHFSSVLPVQIHSPSNALQPVLVVLEKVYLVDRYYESLFGPLPCAVLSEPIVGKVDSRARWV